MNSRRLTRPNCIRTPMGQNSAQHIELARISQEVVALRDFDAPYVSSGSKPVNLEASQCFPVYPRKRTSDLGVNEYTP